MSGTKDNQEPSMEEILSSIRRIIADEDRESRQGGNKTHSENGEDDDEDVLELTEVLGEEPVAGEDKPADVRKPVPASEPQTGAAPAEASRPETRAAPESDERERTPAAETATEPTTEPTAEQEDASTVPSRDEKPDDLISDEAARATASAFSKLAQAHTPDQDPLVAGSGQSVEQLVIEMMRPMIKEWLDQNLPGIAERMVQQELNKLARRAELM